MTSRSRILVIDDDSALRHAVADVLQQAGFDALTEGDAGDAHVVLTSRLLASCPVPQVALTKPVRMAALLASIAQALAADPLPRIGPWSFDVATRTLCRGEERVRLTDKEMAILSHLLQAAAVVSREDLLSHVWGYGEGISTHTLETHIYTLRQKIETDPAQACLLLTEPGGYRLNLES